jgi:hypothetical protein
VQRRVKRRRLPKDRLGDILQASGSLSEDQVAKALDRQEQQPGRFGTHLLELGLVSEDDLAKALAIQYRVPPYLASLSEPQAEAGQRVPRAMARQLNACPVEWDDRRGVLTVAVANPDNLADNDEIRFASGARRVLIQVAPDAVIERLQARVYDGVREVPATRPIVTGRIGTTPVVPKASSGASRRGRVVVADADGKRGRALGGLAEAAGYQVARTRDPGEFPALLSPPGARVWAHASFPREPLPPDTRTYDDPFALLEAGMAARGPLMGEARALAEAAGRTAGLDAETCAQAASLVRFIAGRRGLGATTTDLLELRAWRCLLTGWQPVGPELPPPQGAVLEAVAAYFRSLADGADRKQAATELRTDKALDPGVVTTLLRWAMGTDLLDRMGTRRSLCALFPAAALPERVLRHFEQAGWEVHGGPDPAAAAGHDAVLASMDLGLALLEAPPGGEEPPPVFLVVDDPSAPETMYALRVGAEDVFGPDTHPELIETKLERALVRTPAPQGQVTGTLRDMGLPDLLQILSNGLRSGTVFLDGPRGSAEVVVQEGQIVDARTPGQRGEAALYALVGWEEGNFRIVPEAECDAPTIHGSTEGLLMEGFRLLDEARRDESK